MAKLCRLWRYQITNNVKMLEFNISIFQFTIMDCFIFNLGVQLVYSDTKSRGNRYVCDVKYLNAKSTYAEMKLW